MNRGATLNGQHPMTNAVKIVECPRDAWQGLPGQIPPHEKAAHLRALIAAGFTHIDAVSFVSPAAVPQMADSEQVLSLLAPPPTVEIIGIAVNRKGAERAIRTRAVQTVGFPYSISPEFLRRNQHQTPADSLRILKEILALARESGIAIVTYVSMAFGNPYDDPWSLQAVADACAALVDAGVQQISLADTVGLASSAQIEDTFAAVTAAQPNLEIGAHLHARRADAAEHISAAYRAGCRRFDAALGGVGGCPFAQDELVGNIPTETLVAVLADCGARLPALAPLNTLAAASQQIARQYGSLTMQHP